MIHKPSAERAALGQMGLLPAMPVAIQIDAAPKGSARETVQGPRCAVPPGYVDTDWV